MRVYKVIFERESGTLYSEIVSTIGKVFSEGFFIFHRRRKSDKVLCFIDVTSKDGLK